MSGDLLNSVSQFVRRRQVFLVVVGCVVVLTMILLNVALRIARFEDNTSAASIEPVVDGTFLGIQVADHTHDQFLSNAGLRLAMNEALKASSSIRKYQMATIWLQDGQHPDTGLPAVLVTVQPKWGEIPSPPFETVAIRRWQPDPDEAVSLDELKELRLLYSPNEEDLDHLRLVWSGGRFAKVDSIASSIRRLFLFLAIAIGLIVAAGAYRSLAWQSTRWDRAADTQRHGAALSRLQAARDSKRAKDSMDMN